MRKCCKKCNKFVLFMGTKTAGDLGDNICNNVDCGCHKDPMRYCCLCRENNGGEMEGCYCHCHHKNPVAYHGVGDMEIKPQEKSAVCGLCGEPIPKGEEMFKYHNHSCKWLHNPLAKMEDWEKDFYDEFYIRYYNDKDTQGFVELSSWVKFFILSLLASQKDSLIKAVDEEIDRIREPIPEESADQYWARVGKQTAYRHITALLKND